MLTHKQDQLRKAAYKRRNSSMQLGKSYNNSQLPKKS